PQEAGARIAVLRALHTLKGSARLAGAMRLGELAHRLESAIEALDPGSAGSWEIEALLHRVDSLQDNFDRLRGLGEQATTEVLSVPDALPLEQIADGAAPAVEALSQG